MQYCNSAQPTPCSSRPSDVCNTERTGHDCGHTTFSNYPWVNAICGHLCHAPLLVPFWPWAKSHNEHHKYHNHVHKDMSYPWFGRDQFETEMTRFAKFWLRTPFHPFTSYLFTYLLAGWYDGSHFNPLGEGPVMFLPGNGRFLGTSEDVRRDSCAAQE